MGAPTFEGQLVKRGDREFLLAAVPFGLGNIGELHIAMEGEWQGHSTGGFKLTSDVFDSMVARFEAQKNPLPIDYEHKSFDDRAPDTRAAGWIQKLEKRQGENGYELWAVVEWTESAAGMIRKGEYKYCSPAFALESTDRKSGDKTGPELSNVALTNLPFLDGQSPIRLSFVCAVSAAEQEPPPQAPPAAAPSAPAPDEAAAAQAQALNEQVTAFIDAVAKTAGVDRAAAVAALNDNTDAIAGMVRDSLDADGVPQENEMEKEPKAPAADADKAKKDEIEASARANDATIALSAVEALKSRVDAMEAERVAEKERARTQRVDGMIACGQLLDTEKENALWLLSADPARFDAIFGSRPKVVPIGETQAGPEPVDATKATREDLLPEEIANFNILCMQPGWTPEKAAQRLVAKRNKTQAARRGATKVG